MKTYYISYSVTNRFSDKVFFEGCFSALDKGLTYNGLRNECDLIIKARDMAGESREGDVICIIAVTELDK